MRRIYELSALGIGPFKVGVSAELALEGVSEPVEKFNREDEVFWAVSENQLQMSLDSQGLIQFVEAFAPLQVLRDGLPLIGQNRSKIKEEFGEAGFHKVVGSDSWICLSLGLVFSFRAGKVESVAVFGPGYYDGLPLEKV